MHWCPTPCEALSGSLSNKQHFREFIAPYSVLRNLWRKREAVLWVSCGHVQLSAGFLLPGEGLCPDTAFCTQVQKVSLDHLGPLDLLDPQGPQENVKVKPKWSFRRTSTAANAQVSAFQSSFPLNQDSTIASRFKTDSMSLVFRHH